MKEESDNSHLLKVTQESETHQHIHKSQSTKTNKLYFNTRDKIGVVIIVLVYLLIVKIYLFTVVYGMGPGIEKGEASDIVNGIFLTFFVVMSLVSHFRCMTT